MYRIELRFEDGEARHLDTDGKETIYQAALRGGIPLLTECLEGACATCKARCTRGDYELLDPSFDALSTGEAAAGHVLLCQMQARADCAIELPYALGFAAGAPPRTLEGVVAGLERIAPSVVRLTLALEADPPLGFVAGQYARVRVPGTAVARAYSFANPPSDPVLARFYVRLLEGGAMSAYLARAVLGEPIAVEAPYGGFYLRSGGGPIVMVAGGTGLAPMLSMLAALPRREPRRLTLLHGVREPADRFGAAEIERAAQGLGLDVDIVSQSPAPGWAGSLGRVTDLLRPERFEAEDTDVYVCGPPAMIEAAQARLAELGVPGPRVFAEPFNPAA